VRLAFNVPWKSVALFLALLVVAVVLILLLVFLKGEIGDPCPPYC
jgi:hypothetical protein